MTATASRLQPQHANWNEDLPERESKTHKQEPDLAGQANFICDKFLELGRVPVLVRGIGMFGALGSCVMLWLSTYLVEATWSDVTEQGEYGLFLGSMFGVMVVVAFGTLFYRLDAQMPRQTPVRFSRATGKVYFNSYKFNWNPFGKWRTVLKVWDWNTAQAEIHKTAGFNGKVYQVRYSLLLATCKPGTFEVIDREVLVGPSMTTVEFERAWAYLCKYMADGKSAVPAEPLQDTSVHYIRSLFTYYEWVLPGPWGAQSRKDMFGQSVVVAVFSLFVIGLSLIGAPVFLFLGITNYIALKLAPVALWPAEMDAESRGISMDELQRLKAEERARPKDKVKPASIVAAIITVGLLGKLGHRIYEMWFG